VVGPKEPEGIPSLPALDRILTVRDHWSGAPYRPEMLWGSFAINHPSLPIVFLGLVLLGCWSAYRDDVCVGRLLLVSTLVPSLFLFAMRPALVDGHIARYLVPVLPLQLLAAARGLLAVVERVPLLRRGPPSVVAATAAAFLLLANPAAVRGWFVERLPFDHAVRWLGATTGEGDLLTTFGYPPFAEQMRYRTSSGRDRSASLPKTRPWRGRAGS
jgi:hypothetical protein